ncbi:MAG: Hpt domain-containing protein [Acidimicrobiales bacterium]
MDVAQFDLLRGVAAASGGPSFLRDLVNQYLDQAESELAGLRNAAERADAPALEALAHGLKGSSATIGASRMASACAALGEPAARGDVAEAAELERLADELQRATAALRSATEPSG